MLVFSVFHYFMFTNVLLQSSHELMITKYSREARLIYYVITAMVCLGTNNIRIFRDFKILSHSLKFVFVFITCMYVAIASIASSIPQTYLCPNILTACNSTNYIIYIYSNILVK